MNETSIRKSLHVAILLLAQTMTAGAAEHGAATGTAPDTPVAVADAASAWTVDSTTAPEGADERTVVERLETDPEVELFVRALKRTDAWDRLARARRAVVFVPTDRALRVEGSAFLLDQVLLAAENARRLADLLSHHVVLDGPDLLADPSASLMLVTEGGGCLQVQATGASVKVGPEAYVIASSRVANGTIHFIDRLLWQRYQGEERCAKMLATDDAER